jgi:hypothetical protein
MSQQRAAEAKVIGDQIATGRDEEVRGLTVNKAWASSADRGPMTTGVDEDGRTFQTNGQMRVYSDGTRTFQSLGGAWVSEDAVDAGRRRWGDNHFAQQAALSYEMRKSNTDEQVRNVAENFANVATGQGGWGMADGEARGAWVGAAFENQNQHLEFKYTNWANGQMNAQQAAGFVEEIYQKRGSYPLSQMHADTIKRLQEAHDIGDDDTKRKVQAVAETFMSRGGGGVSPTQRGDDGEVTQPGQVYRGGNQVMAQGAGHLNERVRELAVHVGVYADLDPSTRTDSEHHADPNALPPDHPRQN